MLSPSSSALLLMLSGFAAQGVQFISTIFLARIYSPAAYGDLTLIVNWASAFAAIFSLQLHIAIQVEQDTVSAKGILWVAFCVVPALALPAVLVAATVNNRIILIAIILGSAVAFSNIGRAALARNSANTAIAGLNVSRSILAVTAQFWLRNLGQFGLVFGLLLAEVVTAITYFALSITGRSRPKRHSAIRVISKNVNFTAWGVLQELVAIGAVLSPFLICDLIYDADVVGNYGVAYRLIWAPAVIASFGFGLVFLTEISRAPEHFSVILRNMHAKKLFALLIILGVSSFFWAPQLFTLVLGSDWHFAAAISPAVTIAAISFLMSAPYRQLYRVHQKQRTQMCVDTFTIALIFITSLLPTMKPLHWVSVICALVVLQNTILIYIAHKFQRNFRSDSV